MGIKAPRGYGVITNPKKALYNRVYNRTTVSVDNLSKPKRASGVSHYSGGSEASEAIVAYLAGAAVMVGILCWLGLSFKWAMLLVVGAVIYGVAGEGGVWLALILLAVIGHYLV